MKEDAYNEACEVFEGSGVNVVTDGVNVLGCPIGVESFVQSKAELAIDDWCREVELLAEVAIPQPQAAYSSFVHGFFCEMG